MMRKFLKGTLAAAILTATAFGCESGTSGPPLGPPGEVAHVTPDTFYDQVLESDFPAYMEFGTEMCYGCQMMKEDLAKLAPEFEG
ncbi:MAG: hypothetical protein ABIB71_09705, partial [Candidatus Woesearchaeota archaeon]